MESKVTSGCSLKDMVGGLSQCRMRLVVCIDGLALDCRPASLSRSPLLHRAAYLDVVRRRMVDSADYATVRSSSVNPKDLPFRWVGRFYDDPVVWSGPTTDPSVRGRIKKRKLWRSSHTSSHSDSAPAVLDGSGAG